MINLDDVPDGLRELERATRLGLSGAMITEYPAEDRRYDQPEYEPFWAAGIRPREVIGVHNMMWGSDYPHGESTFPDRGRSWRKSWRACRTTNRPSLPRTTIRGSPAATPPACTILTWRSCSPAPTRSSNNDRSE
jgi:hypothetical protein